MTDKADVGHIEVQPEERREKSGYGYIESSKVKMEFIINKLKITKSFFDGCMEQFISLHKKRIDELDREEQEKATGN